MDIPHDTLVVVLDGEKLLMFRNEGDEKYPNLVLDKKEEQDNPPDREQSANRRGRVHESVGSHRSAYEDTDFHQLAEDRFAAEAGELLKSRALSNDFEKLIIAAPPNTLGELRDHYHVEVKNRLIGEVDKELTGHPVAEIEKIISES